MGPPGPTASVELELHDGRVVIRIVGDLDLAGVPDVEAALAEAEDRASTIVVDLSHLRFIDSMGMRCLLRAGTRANRDGHRLSVRRAPRSVQRVFDLTRAERILDFVD